MKDYIREILEEMNPCEPEPGKYCKYSKKCFYLRENSKKFLCISNLAYQTAFYLIDSDIETEKNDLKKFMESRINSKRIIIADPKEKKWKYQEPNKVNIETITNKIINRAQEIYDLASFLERQKTS